MQRTRSSNLTSGTGPAGRSRGPGRRLRFLGARGALASVLAPLVLSACQQGDPFALVSPYALPDLSMPDMGQLFVEGMPLPIDADKVDLNANEFGNCQRGAWTLEPCAAPNQSRTCLNFKHVSTDLCPSATSLNAESCRAQIKTPLPINKGQRMVIRFYQSYTFLENVFNDGISRPAILRMDRGAVGLSTKPKPDEMTPFYNVAGERTDRHLISFEIPPDTVADGSFYLTINSNYRCTKYAPTPPSSWSLDSFSVELLKNPNQQ